MKQTTINQLINEMNETFAAVLSHSQPATPFAAISMLPSAPAAFAFAGYPCVDAGAAAANADEKCTVISKRRTMNWAGRQLERCGSSG